MKKNISQSLTFLLCSVLFIGVTSVGFSGMILPYTDPVTGVVIAVSYSEYDRLVQAEMAATFTRMMAANLADPNLIYSTPSVSSSPIILPGLGSGTLDDLNKMIANNPNFAKNGGTYLLTQYIPKAVYDTIDTDPKTQSLYSKTYISTYGCKTSEYTGKGVSGADYYASFILTWSN